MGLSFTGVTREQLSSLDQHAQTRVLRDDPLSQELQHQLLEELLDGFDDRLSFMARNLLLLPEVQLQIARCRNHYARAAMARNPSASAEVQEVLGRDRDVVTRRALASNVYLDPRVQLVLAEDEWLEVRRSLGENRAVKPRPELPYRFLRDDLLDGMGYLKEHLEGLDPGTLSVLADEWDGSLAGLLVAVEQFSPAQV